jgi:PhnB protein
MHASLQIGDTTVFASDGEGGGRPNFQGISLSLTASDEADAERLFAALAEGGKVMLPLTKTFFSPRFDMIADRFGVSWIGPSGATKAEMIRIFGESILAQTILQ